MMDLSQLNNLGGWEYKPQTIDRVVAAYGAQNFWDAHPELKGAHKGKVVMAHTAISKLTGGDFSYPNQTIGNCVGRGGSRCGDLLQCLQGQFHAFTLSAGVYGGARYEIGYEEKGSRSSIRGDGAVVAYAVECMTEIGALLAQKYEVGGKTYDFNGRHNDDKLDKQWGQSGIPDELEPLMDRFKVEKWNVLRTGEETADAIASGMVGIFGTSLAHWTSLPAKRDSKGFLKLRGTTAHCWIVTGTVDDNGTTGLVLDNKSWGDNWVEGPDGGLPLGNGRYLCHFDDFTKIINRGEAYALSAFGGAAPAPPDKIDWITL